MYYICYIFTYDTDHRYDKYHYIINMIHMSLMIHGSIVEAIAQFPLYIVIDVQQRKLYISITLANIYIYGNRPLPPGHSPQDFPPKNMK